MPLYGWGGAEGGRWRRQEERVESPPSPGPAAGRRTTRAGRGPASAAAIATAGRRRWALLPTGG